MSVHDWMRVDAAIFHAFHHGWITEIARALNRELLPADYYALSEQHAAGFGPDVLTMHGFDDDNDVATEMSEVPFSGERTGRLSAPKLEPVGETDLAFY